MQIGPRLAADLPAVSSASDLPRARRDLRPLRGAIQYRAEIQADQVRDALLLQPRLLARKLPAQHAGRGQLGREAAPGRLTAPGDRFPGKEVAGFPGRADGTRRAPAQRALRRLERAHMLRRRQISMNLPS